MQRNSQLFFSYENTEGLIHFPLRFLHLRGLDFAPSSLDPIQLGSHLSLRPHYLQATSATWDSYGTKYLAFHKSWLPLY